MNPFLDVWKPHLAIPQPLQKAAAAFHRSPELTLREDIDCLTLAGVECLCCEHVVKWHKDEHIPDPYTLLLVLRNDRGWCVESGERLLLAGMVPQGPGTLILLNIHQSHRLWFGAGPHDPLGVWLAAHLDLPTLPRTRQDCVRRMREHLKGCQKARA